VRRGKRREHGRRERSAGRHPYDPKSERLPHSEVRTMITSWVVEPTSEGIKDKEEGVMEVFRTRGMVKGMWRFLDRPRMNCTLL
jgi:hypothetical protein